MEQVKINKILSIVLVFVFFSVLLFFWVKQYQVYIAEKQVKTINKILDENVVWRDNCKPILDFNKTLISSDNKFFNEWKYDIFREKCDKKYNIANVKLDEEECIKIIKSEKEGLYDKYIILDDFNNIQNKCIDKFLKVDFSTWSFFEVDNDFKSTINIDFSLDFFEDSYEEWTKKYIDNRIKAKQKLINLLEIEPKININIDNIVLYPKKAILYLNLKPETKYNFSLKSFKTSTWKETEKQNFIFTTPKNQFFWFKINKKVSLFQDTNQPNFTFYRYNNNKKEAKIKICRIDNEAYAKIEVYDDFPNRDFRRNFFKNWIDKIKTFDCKTKTINLMSPPVGGDAWKAEGDVLIKKEFNFSEEIWDKARSGLYYVTFENQSDREYNNIIQKPIFFWIIDSHITMKISANWEAFFFVNDFNWNPLVNQDIRVYLNDFKSKKHNYNYDKDKDESIYYSPFEKNVLSKAINLWKTWKDWILKVDLKWKIDDAFSRTFDSWDYSYNWNLNSLFVTSASKNNLSFVSSKHNGWITPWNFGYSIWSWWYWDRAENADEITLKSWWVEPEIYSHIFTDRKLYLPWEEVNIKGILRNSKDLSIPKNKKIKLIVKDQSWKELLNKYVVVNNYGSFSETIKLNNNSKLWNYYINLSIWNNRIWRSGFSVEVFKNPKFKNEIMLETKGLNKDLVKITKTEIDKDYYRDREKYLWNFNIKARISSKYYNWSKLKNAEYKYRVFKQYYYDTSYWNECYYGCYWEPDKVLYTEWKGVLDKNWNSNIDIPVKFESSYSDYKYIVEVTVKDAAGDTISSSNSIIARLPDEYKKWDPDSWINFTSSKRFYKSWDKIEINGTLNHWKFSKFYNDKFLLIIKKKDYKTKIVKDVRWYKRPVTSSIEKIEKILLVNTDNFVLNDKWKLSLEYIAKDTWEYVFEFGKVNKNYLLNPDEVIKKFQEELKNWNLENFKFKKNFKDKVKVNYDTLSDLVTYCDIDSDDCNRDYILKKLWCNKDYIDVSCENKEKEIEIPLTILADDLIDPDTNRFFTIISYWDKNSTNPIISDNKLQILSEKTSYHIWEKARILIRLPESNWKILLTKEKQWVVDSELINVKSNIFFKEFLVDDSFAPNTYISALFIPSSQPKTLLWEESEQEKVPEYKVWYTEIVVDKTDKKSFINIIPEKKVYKPRETVKLDIDVTDINKKAVKSELTVMVVDDSLISLMWNIDLNVLEKFYKKLPFRIQTAITNIAMLKNYYFSRRWIVGWSWANNLKGWDWVVSSRNIFRNTAYYNPSVITDNNWKAHIEFNLPDNLTNYRIMVVSNSKNNLFGMWEDFIEVRKNVIVEDKTPLILRYWDISEIWAQIFNTTDNDISFNVKLESKEVDSKNNIKNIIIKKWDSKYVSWNITVPNNIEKINYKISAIWDSKDNSDIIENKIDVKEPPVLITNIIKNLTISWAKNEAWIWELKINIPDNIDINKSKVEVIFSNNKLSGIEKIVSSLAKYPYWCIEQTVSSTMPNAIILKFSNIYWNNIVNKDKALVNLKSWIERIKSMQLESWWFWYWQWGNIEASLNINSFVLWSLLEIQKVYKDKKLDEMINKNIVYLESKFFDKSISNNEKIGVFLALAKAKKKNILEINSANLNEYDLINYTYALFLTDKNKFSTEIDLNIKKIKQLVKIDNNNNYYTNSINNKALFLQLLISLNYDKNYIDILIWDLYSKNWNNYYYSTKTKNNSFLSFAKYLEKYSTKRISKFGFMIWNVLNRGVVYSVWDRNNVLKKFDYNLSKLISPNDKSFSFKVANLHSADLFATIIIKDYPKDILKVKPYSNNISVKREIFEVLDETKLDECTSYWNYYKYKTYSDEFKLKCDKVLKKVDNNIYKKWALYRVKITSNLTNTKSKNFVIEDYLPGAFRIINSKFKTESALVTQNSKSNNWYWNYIEYNPNVVMAHDKYVWWNKKELSYYVRAEFTWIYMQPPVTWYYMYNPLIRANTWFNIIEVK